VVAGAVEAMTTDVETLTQLLREAEEHHGEYEPAAPKHHWSTWYAAYIVARQEGRSTEEAVAAATADTEAAPGAESKEDHG
jgi:hypothetical protein